MMNELTDKQKGEFFELPVEMGIFVPSTKNASVPVSESEFESRVRQVEDFVAKLFGGFSSFDDIQGGYYSDDLKEVIREEVKEVRFFANAGAFTENIKGLLNQITLWCLEWGQEAIGFEIEGDLFYVGANSKIYRYGGETYANGGVTLSHVDVSMAPMGERTQVGSEGDTYLGQNAFLYKNGGQVDYSREMIKSQNKEIAHHSSELSAILNKYKNMKVEPWVIGKLERASTDLSDVTHYFDGKEDKDYYAKGGSVEGKMSFEDFEETLLEYEIEGGFGKTLEKGYKMWYLPKNHPYGNVKFNHRNKRKAYKQYLEMEKYAQGGDIPVKIVNKGKTYNRGNYKAIYGDFDKDGLMNSDDPNPIKKGDKRRVEQLSFPKIFDNLLDTKGKLDSTMYDAVDTLKKITPDGGKIYARTKTPYSIINKLIDSRMIVSKDPKKGLTDMVGTTIVVDNVDDVMQVQKEIESGALGEIVPEGYDKNGNVILADDKYKNPKGGYRAIHYIIMMDGIPVEVQLKTKRMKEINELAHPHYKAKNLNSDYMNYLTDLADKGDRGDVKAQREFNSIMRNKKNVSEKLKLDSTYMYAMGGRVEEIYGDEMDLDGIFEDFKED
jgi:ppGpp synthetase/RelA/SpoT-type nucleotidyltranferase